MDIIRASGILLHPTSFPSVYGIGDLGKSAYDFIDFLEMANQKLWQVLPLCPTSFGDSPYQSFSTFAGNPLLISPDILIEKGFLSDDFECYSDTDPDKVDYGQVIEFKNTLFKKAFNSFNCVASYEQKLEFEHFCDTNKDWLDDYSLFVSLKNYFIELRKDKLGSEEYVDFCKCNSEYLSANLLDDYFFGAVWCSWPDKIKMRDTDALKEWGAFLASEIQFNKFLQFEFFSQWSCLKDYANEKNIRIIGDIPIFVAFDSADTWANPSLFYLDCNGYPSVIAGVPPDYFSATGQLWGNPLYNWSEHKLTGYNWWVSRIRAALFLVDIIRIDHFRGFESFWAIPFGEDTAENGEWVKGPNADLFCNIERCLGELPIIAEDLGLITEDVRTLRDLLMFPGMNVLQFAFESDESNQYLPHNHCPNSVVYTGTHDNDTTIGWYNKASDSDKDLFRRYMNVSGDCPNWDLIRLAMSSVSKFAIIPLQDLIGLDSIARLNTPGVASGNWQWRYSVDSLDDELANDLRAMTKLFGR